MCRQVILTLELSCAAENVPLTNPGKFTWKMAIKMTYPHHFNGVPVSMPVCMHT